MTNNGTTLPATIQQAPATTRTTPLTPTTFAEAVQFAEMMAKSTMVPGEYRGKPENILLALQFGAELGLSPLQAVQSIATINGRPAVYGDAMLAMVRGSPLCDDVIESFEGTGDDLTAVCDARRRGKAPVIARFSVADAKRARLWGKGGPWTEYPKRMLQWRARGFALRDAFPDLLRGVISLEEARDIPSRDMVDITPPRPPANPATDLDAFAAEPLEPDYDGQGRMVAAKGTDALRFWWNSLPPTIQRQLQDHLPEYKAIAAAVAEPFGLTPPAERDPVFWTGATLGLGPAADGREFRALMHHRLREARTAREVEALRADNPQIDQLPRSDKDEVLGMLMDRELELRAAEASA